MASPDHVLQQSETPQRPQGLIPSGSQPQETGSIIPQKRRLKSAIGHQKTKVTRACDLCKAKKSKCSGEQPCDSCNRRGLDCQYEALYSRGKAPMPRRIESPNNAGQGRENTAIEPYQTPNVHPVNLPRSSGLGTTPPGATTRPRNSEVAYEVPSRGSPGLEVAGQYSDPTSALLFLQRAWRRISNNESSQVMNGELGSTESNQPLMRAGDKPFQKPREIYLPSLSRSRELLVLYFDVCMATYRLLHRPTVESWLVKVLENAQMKRPLFFDLGRANTAVVLTVLAVASFHEEKARGCSPASPTDTDMPHSRSDELFSEAFRCTEEETGLPRLESAQARLIQVLYLLTSCRFNQAWYLLGHTLQIISALGLHRRDVTRRPTATPKRDYIKEQCVKRTFWIAYMLDKYLAVIFGRPRHYHDDDINQDFPDPVNDDDMTHSGPKINLIDDCLTDALIFHAKLAQIAEKISREVYSIKSVPDQTRLASAHRLGAELREWKSSLPPFLGAIKPSSLIPSLRRQATALKLYYYHAVMLTYRPFLLRNTTRNNDAMRDTAKNGLNECITAAQSVLEEVDSMAREGRMFHAFWWTHYVCFCALAIVYVWAIQESNRLDTLNDRRIILDKAENCLQHLEQATASNSPSRKYTIILQELRAEAKRETARSMREQPQMAKTSTENTLQPYHINPNPTTVNDPLPISDTAMEMWQPLFGSPIDTAMLELQNSLDDWQTIDWLQLDSSAFGPFPDFDHASLSWVSDLA